MNTWNYRIGTYMFSYKETFPDNEHFNKMEDVRLYCIVTAYYENKNKVPHSYSLNEKNILDGFDNKEDLTGTVNKISVALNKPILDLDNFPNEYKE